MHYIISMIQKSDKKKVDDKIDFFIFQSVKRNLLLNIKTFSKRVNAKSHKTSVKWFDFCDGC